jgi:hypothetical protein
VKRKALQNKAITKKALADRKIFFSSVFIILVTDSLFPISIQKFFCRLEQYFPETFSIKEKLDKKDQISLFF